MNIISRILANVIDIFIYLVITIISYIYILPIFLPYFNSPTLPGILTFILTILITFIIQYPFLTVSQTVGKAFFSFEIISIDTEEKANISLIIQREIFLKVITCYIICLPVLYGKVGGHEIATQTKVVTKQRIR